MNTKSSTSYRLSAEAKSLLASIAQRANLSQAAVLELAVRAYAAQATAQDVVGTLQVTCPECQSPLTFTAWTKPIATDPGVHIRISREPIT